ncbi:MAG: DUF6599 family protein [Bacteroidota bacterium]
MKLKLLLPAILSGATILFCSSLKGADVSFPQIEGWKKAGEIKSFEPNTLWDYINGAAESYQSYNFELLEVCDYTSGDDYITVEVYRHATPAHAFGIYSTERPRESEFLEIGTEGYHESGSLNFLKDRYYVKMHASGSQAENDLVHAAGAIAKHISGEKEFPKGVYLLPEENKVAKSTLFVAKNVLGYSFLNNGYLADYESQAGDYRVFLFVKEDVGPFDAMLNAYFEKCGSKKKPSEGMYALDDPYNGIVYLTITEDYAVGTLDVEKKNQAKEIFSTMD